MASCIEKPSSFQVRRRYSTRIAISISRWKLGTQIFLVVLGNKITEVSDRY